jgi:hypothetical protein
LDDWIYWLLIHTTRNYRQYRGIADLHTLQFTVTHALGFSVFTSRILVTDFITASLSLQITHEVFLSLPNYFLAIILQLPISKTRLNSNPLLPSSYPDRLASRNSNFQSTAPLPCLLYNYFERTTQKTQPLLLEMRSYSAVAWQRKLLAYSLPRIYVYRVVAHQMNVYSDFTIPAFGRHVTVYIKYFLFHLYAFHLLRPLVIKINSASCLHVRFSAAFGKLNFTVHWGPQLPGETLAPVCLQTFLWNIILWRWRQNIPLKSL